MALVTLQTIFQDAFPAYEQRHALPAHVRRAAYAIMQCRTAALGGHVQACPDGHMSRIWYNSCRHRSCLQCAYLQTERWLALQQARLLACDHYHVIFTLPHELNPLWLANVRMMTTLLFQAVRDTLDTLLADPHSLGAQPGIMAALHTQPDAGPAPARALPRHRRGGLRTDTGRPCATGFCSRHAWSWPCFGARCSAPSGGPLPGTRWCCQRPCVPSSFSIFSIGSATRRRPHGMCTFGALSSRSRCGHVSSAVPAGRPDQERPPGGVRRRLRHLHLSHAAGGGRRRACRPQRMTLSVADFLQRWLLHVPVPQTRVVRSYGLYHPTQAKALAVCRTALGQLLGGGARAADLADGVCPAWGGPSRAVSHLRAAARVHRRYPARGAPPLERAGDLAA